MKNSWTKTFRRLAAATVVVGSTSYSSAMCYANAFASATDPVYNNGWQAGDDEGPGGFGPWDFTGTAASAVQQAMDDGLKSGSQTSAPFNDIGEAWTMFNPEGQRTTAYSPFPPGEGTDISRAGRLFDSPLKPNQTFSVTIDNPSAPTPGNYTYAGYNVKFFAGATLQAKFEQFHFFQDKSWYIGDTDGAGLPVGSAGETGLLNTDTDGGAQVDLRMTDADSYLMAITPLDNPALKVVRAGNLNNLGAGPIDRVQFEFFRLDSDSYPAVLNPRASTDFYISQMSIVPEPGTATLLLFGMGGTLLGLARARRRDEE